jgi:SSS family transporter
MHEPSLHPLNIATFAVYIGAMLAMGLFFSRRNKSSDDYFRGGGKLPWWAVSLSIYATMFSSITFLSVPAMVYHTDMRYFSLSFGILLLVPLVVRWYLPFFRKLNLTSAYEYLEVRFNLACRLFASAAFIMFMVARTAIVTYLPAVAISAVVGLDVNWAIAAVTVVTIFYCTLGGVEAVVWSDFVQALILIFGTAIMFAFMIVGTDGGLSGYIEKGLAAGKFHTFDFALDWTQPCFWVVFAGGIVANLASYTSDQCVVQRYMTTRDEKGAAKSICLNGVLSFVNNIAFFLLGVALFTFISSHPGFLPTTIKGDAVFPYFIGFGLPPGVSGLILAAVAAATMSTLSSNLNAAASAFATDFFKRLSRRDVSDASLMRCGKICTVLVGLLGGGFALVLANMEIKTVFDQFQKFLGVLTGGLGCLFFMGIFMKRVNAFGATVGLLVNYVVCFSVDFVKFSGKPHILTYGALGMIACLFVAPAASKMSCLFSRRNK